MLAKTTHPVNLMLNNVEYLLLKIGSHPGKSQRFYRRALENYRNGFSKHHTGEKNEGIKRAIRARAKLFNL
mgnify:CR=1 FL=1